MLINTGFAADAAPDRVFALLTNVDAVAGCIPGGSIEPGDGSPVRRGAVDVRLGMMRFSFRGQFSFVENDAIARRAVIEGEGLDQAGQGSARARVVLGVAPEAGGAVVQMQTDLKLTGPIAQMGAGLIQEFAQEIVDDFAARLAAMLAPPAGPQAAAAARPREIGGLGLVLRVLLRRLAALFRRTR